LRKSAIGKAHVSAEARFVRRIFNASFEFKEYEEVKHLIEKADRLELEHFLEDKIGIG